MELVDLTRKDWEAILRALYLREREDRAMAEKQAWLRKSEIEGWADHQKALHDRLQEEFRVRALRGELAK